MDSTRAITLAPVRPRTRRRDARRLFGKRRADHINDDLTHYYVVRAVLRIDPAAGEVLDEFRDIDILDEFRDIDIPARIAFGFGSVWISDSSSNRLYRISPAG